MADFLNSYYKAGKNPGLIAQGKLIFLLGKWKMQVWWAVDKWN